MEKKLEQTDNDERPKAPALGFFKGTKEDFSPSAGVEGDDKSRKRTRKKSEIRPRKVKYSRKSNSEKSNELQGTRKKASGNQAIEIAETSHYDIFSTKARRSLQRTMSKLSYLRKDSNSEIQTIKQFIELSIVDWLEKEDSLRSKKELLPKQARAQLDPLDLKWTPIIGPPAGQT